MGALESEDTYRILRKLFESGQGKPIAHTFNLMLQERHFELHTIEYRRLDRYKLSVKPYVTISITHRGLGLILHKMSQGLETDI